MGTTAQRIVIVGGGFVGPFSARRLQRRLRRETDVVFLTPRNFMTHQPFLPEAAVGSLEPRHVVVPLRRTLPQIALGRDKFPSRRRGMCVAIWPRNHGGWPSLWVCRIGNEGNHGACAGPSTPRRGR